MDKNTTYQLHNNNSTQKITQAALFKLSDCKKKPVTARFTLEKTSSNGGVLLLKEIENQIGIIKALAACITDSRNQSYVRHEYETMLFQRVMQIAAGYEDANDCNELRFDKLLQTCSGSDSALASQPTMSRFENLATPRLMYRMAEVFVNHFILSYSSQPEVIILDCDDTSAITHGCQQLSLFNTYYGDSCYMPLHIYEGFSGKVIATILKPGRRSKGLNVHAILKRVVLRLRQHWPNTIIILRGDSHFCSQEFMDWSENHKNVEFLTGITANQVLNKLAKKTIQTAKKKYEATGKPVKLYHSFEYKANSWEHSQRTVVKVEYNRLGLNTRFIVSSMRCINTQQLYENAYCARGAAELRIKDHKTYLNSDRMSCSNFMANQFRLLLHSAAYVLIHALQNEVLKNTEFETATMKTIQLKIIKIAAQVKVMKTKIEILLPAVFPTREIFEKSLRIFYQLRI